MTVIDRLKMELGNQEYFPDAQYIQFLTENDLVATDEYVKKDMQRRLLFTVLDILNAIANDVDVMTSISTEFSNVGEAYGYLEARIQNVQDKILTLPVERDNEFNCFSLMYTRRGVPSLGSHAKPIDRDTLDKIIEEEF